MKIALDPHPFARGGSWAIVCVSAMHIFQAAMMLTWPVKAYSATSLIALLKVFHVLGSPDGTHFLSAVMIASALFGLWGATCRMGWARLAVFVPQHILLGIMTGGAVWAWLLGHYLDGTVVPWQHIATDQIVLIALFAVHTSAIVRRCRDPNG